MDWYVQRPSDSVLWTPCFVGNGEGFLTEGPFAGWYGGYSIDIKRNIGRASGECPPRLIRRSDIDDLLKHCHYSVKHNNNRQGYLNAAASLLKTMQILKSSPL